MDTPDPFAPSSPDAWADPGFTLRQSRLRNALHLLKQIVRGLKGEKTVPTAVGIALIGLSIGIGVAAYNTSSNILFLTLSLILSCLILSGVLAWMNLHGTRWRLIVPARLRVGESAPVGIDLVNTKKTLPTYSLCFEVVGRVSGASSYLCQEQGLDPGESAQLRWCRAPEQRGRDVIALHRLESLFPFGFLRKSLLGGLEQEIMVWPRRIGYTFHPNAGSRRTLQGQTTPSPGQGAELVNLRNYRSGDPTRIIHWKASARMKLLMARETTEDRQDAYFLFLETPASLWTEPRSFETLCSVAATLAEDLYASGQIRGAGINNEPVHLFRKHSDLSRFLDRLAVLRPEPDYIPAEPSFQATTITFSPGSDDEVILHVGSHYAGVTQAERS